MDTEHLEVTKQVYGKALTKLVKKVKHLEDQLKSTTKRRKEKVVISHEEEDLVSEDPSKQERMSKTKYGNVETEHAEEESSEVHLDVLKRLSKATPEKESPLEIWRKLYGRLQVEEDSEAARDLVKTNHKSQQTKKLKCLEESS
ncbi:hypothetical protein Tco_1173792 [Tanacetum coccineum]